MVRAIRDAHGNASINDAQDRHAISSQVILLPPQFLHLFESPYLAGGGTWCLFISLSERNNSNDHKFFVGPPRFTLPDVRAPLILASSPRPGRLDDVIRLADPSPQLIACGHRKRADADASNERSNQSNHARLGPPDDGRFAFRVLIPGMHRERPFRAEFLFAGMTFVSHP